MQSDVSSGGNDHLDGLESQVDASSEVSVCLLVLSFYLAISVCGMQTCNLKSKVCDI